MNNEVKDQAPQIDAKTESPVSETGAITNDFSSKSNDKPQKKRKRRLGDRREGRRLRTLDGLHVAMPFITMHHLSPDSPKGTPAITPGS